MARRTIPWPPASRPRKERRDHYVIRDGEPVLVELERWAGDVNPSGEQFEICCECGLTHLITYELEYAGRGAFLLRKRYYRAGQP